MIYCWTKWIAMLFVLSLLATCGTDDSGSGTISGVVYDVSSTSSGVPLAGATVTLRNTGNTALSSTTSASDGSYTLVNVPAPTDVYINVSMAGYAGFNTEILSTNNDPAKRLIIKSAVAAKSEADKFYGSAGGASWNDFFYTSKSWFSMDIAGLNYIQLWPGVSVGASPSDVVIVYNNGSDVYTASGATSGTAGSYPQVGGYGSSGGVYTFTLTMASSVTTVKLPSVPGEITYSAIWWL